MKANDHKIQVFNELIEAVINFRKSEYISRVILKEIVSFRKISVWFQLSQKINLLFLCDSLRRKPITFLNIYYVRDTTYLIFNWNYEVGYIGKLIVFYN